MKKPLGYNILDLYDEYHLPYITKYVYRLLKPRSVSTIYNEYLNNRDTLTWETADKRKILVKDITNTNLQNALNMIIYSNKIKHKEWVRIFRLELIVKSRCQFRKIVNGKCVQK